MITTDTAITELQRMLDDEEGEMYTRDQILGFLQDGYDRLCREGQVLFDIALYDVTPRAANYTRDFERDYIDGPIYGKFTCTRESDVEFCEGDAIVSNHTKPSDAAYMTESGKTPTVTGLRVLPENYVSVDRVVHDKLRLEPEHDRYNRLTRTEYQTLQGGVFKYQMDQDGWRNLRLVNVPPAINQPDRFPDEEYYSFNPLSSSSTHYGFVKYTGDDYTYVDTSEEDIVGGVQGWPGLLKSVADHIVQGGPYGFIKDFIQEEDSTRVEYFRLGRDLSEAGFEIPDRYVRYVQWWALYRCYSTPGECENRKMAEHFKLRFQAGIDKLKGRLRNEMRDRTIAMGGKRLSIRDNYLEHFPADYGYKRPFRRR